MQNRLRAAVLCALVGATVLGFAFVLLSAVCAQNNQTADIRVLVDQLGTPNEKSDTLEKVVKLAQKDPRAREYVVQKLPQMIREPYSDLWMDAVRLAGRLKAIEAIPALQEAMSRPPVPTGTFFTLGPAWLLDGDIVAQMLSRIGEPAIPAVATLLKSEDWARRHRALLILRNIGTPAARRVMEDQLPLETNRENRGFIEGALSEVNTAPDSSSHSNTPVRVRVGGPGNMPVPHLVNKVSPVYPTDAAAKNVTGVVRLRVVVDTHGGVKQAAAVSGDPLLTGAAVRAVRQWRYQPILWHGYPAEAEFDVEVNVAPRK